MLEGLSLLAGMSAPLAVRECAETGGDPQSAMALGFVLGFAEISHLILPTTREYALWAILGTAASLLIPRVARLIHPPQTVQTEIITQTAAVS